MLKSMTGFGRAETDILGKQFIVEIRSVNSKQLDISMRNSSVLKDKEHEIKTHITKSIERGKVESSMYFENNAAEGKSVSVNVDLVKLYYSEIKKVATELNENTNTILDIVFRMPDVFNKNEKAKADEGIWEQVLTALDACLNAFNTFRLQEGKALEQDLKFRIANISDRLKKIETLDGDRILRTKNKLLKSLADNVEQGKIDQSRFEQELIYYLEKLDVTEERIRLANHLTYFIETCNEDSSGRKLGFISQEIGREINTIGSKANDADMQRCVVEMKDELEKIKEQLLNVL